MVLVPTFGDTLTVTGLYAVPVGAVYVPFSVIDSGDTCISGSLMLTLLS